MYSDLFLIFKYWYDIIEKNVVYGGLNMKDKNEADFTGAEKWIKIM